MAAGAATIAVAAAAAAVAVRAPGGPGFDYRTVPPPHARTEARLRAESIGLARAIEIAVRETGGGVVASAAHVRRTEPLDAISLLVHHDGLATRLLLESGSGAVLERRSVPRLPGAAVEGEPIDGPDGVSWYVLEEGRGDPPPTADSNVRIEYDGWLLDGTRFDSSRDIGRPVTLPLSNFLPGWAAGMREMRPGERRKLIVPPEGAFGAMGNPPLIPPDATLVIDVTLLKVVDYVNLPATIPGWPVTEPPVRREDGLCWWDLQAGDPEGDAVPDLDAIVEIHLRGYLTDGTVFTDSRGADGLGRPLRIDLRRWLTGPAEAIVGLRPGARRKVVAPAALAYGTSGRRTVPPRATIILDIELLGMVDR
jgi:peptidylprolyl isomerase